MAVDRLNYFHPRHGIVVVKRGFSWPAFLFGSLWAAAKRLWLPVFALMVPVDLVCWFVTGYAEGQKDGTLAVAGLLLILVYATVRGWWGNRWHEAALIRHGYTLQQVLRSDRREFIEPTL